MIRCGLFAVVACGLLATPVLAQTVRIQSGDHPGFTRLVLAIGADRDWQLEQQTPEEWALTLDPPVDGFDVTAAFDLIQRTRLAALSGADSLSLLLSCACGVESFRFDERFLVIDITDPDPNTPPPEEPTSPDLAERQAAAAALPDLAELLATPTGLPSIVPRPQSAPADADPPIAPAPSAVAGATENPRLAEAAEIMAEQLARAAAAGLLDASLNQPMTIGDPPPSHDATPEPDEVHAADPMPDPAEDHAAGTEPFPSGPLPIRAETAFDTAIQLDLPMSPHHDAAGCSGTPFDMRDWASGTRFDHELGTLRQALFDERDVLTPEGATNLARYYLYYGFGAEAHYWLSELDTPPEDLLHVAALVDGAATAPFPDVETPAACSQGELLWRYLGGSVQMELTSDDTAALQRAFGDLPPGLRDLMGPRLARQLAEDGLVGTARNIRDVVERGGRVDAAIRQALDFDLGISPATGTDDTRSALAEALRDDGGDPVSIMALALAFDRSTGQRPASSRLVAAEALLRENGNGPETGRLWHEVLLGHAALGQIDQALNMLNDPARIGDAHDRALTDLFADRVMVGDTAALVILAHTHGAEWRPEGSAGGRVQVQAIAALREAGLFEAAQILRDVRRPLILPAPEADPADAEDETLAAWRARNWGRLAETATGPHGDIAARMASLASADAAPGDPQDTALASTGPDLDAMAEVVRDSRDLRATVADLLSRPTPP